MEPGAGFSQETGSGHALILTILLLLFCFRVLAQLLQLAAPVSFLPPFDAWESGAVPYPLLFLIQVALILVCARAVWRLRGGAVVPSEQTGKVLFTLGALYFGLMCARLGIGLTAGRDHFWFGATLPTLFHLVLASIMMVYGHFHIRHGLEPGGARS